MRSLAFFLLFSFAPCIIFGQAYTPYYLLHLCNNGKNLKSREGLDQLVRTLDQNLNRCGSSPDFAIATNNSLSLYALLQCRRDLPAADCARCLTAAAADLNQRCPLQVDAMVWFDGCFLRHDSQNFFYRLDTQYYYDFWNPRDSNNPAFVEKRKEFIPALACEAASSHKGFAMGSRYYNSTHKIYGLVQCNQDLSMDDCSQCLKVAVDRISGPCQQDYGRFCEGKIGRRVLMKNCYIQYEQDMFFNNYLEGLMAVRNCYAQNEPHGCTLHL